jgi:parvulin-like peptidyl-prolyl isomerase
MRRAILIFVWLAFAFAAERAAAVAQTRTAGRVVDHIVARIEGDIILESQVRELAAFQQLIEGRAESDDKLLAELIEQWIVQTEAEAAHFPAPARSEVDREMGRLTTQFGTAESYSAKLKQLGLSPEEVRELLQRQIYIERYLDYKFRPTVQIEPAAIDAYYHKELVPEMEKNNQPVPSRADVEEQIREVLVQRGISDLTAKWLDETKSRLKIEPSPSDAKPESWMLKVD